MICRKARLKVIMTDLLLYGILMLVFGIALTIYMQKIVRWVNRSSLIIFRVAPWLNFSGKTDEKIMRDWNEPVFHYWEVFIIWLGRIFGIVAVGFGLLLIYAFITSR